jgi:hypothetical protein
VLPNLLTLAEAGALVAHVAPIDVGIVLPVIPMTPPPDSLQEDDGDVTAEDRHSGDKLGHRFGRRGDASTGDLCPPQRGAGAGAQSRPASAQPLHTRVAGR